MKILNMGKLSLVAIVASLAMTGCGSSPESKVEDYLDAWNSGDLEEVKEYLSVQTQERLDEKMDRCVSNKMDDTLNARFKEIKKEVDDVWGEHNPFSKEMELTAEEDKRIGEDAKKAKKQEKDPFPGAARNIMHIANAHVEHSSAIKKSGLSKALSPLAVKYYAFLYWNKRARFNGADRYEIKKLFKSLILEELKEKEDSTLKDNLHECTENYFKVGSISDVNIIEIEDISADRKSIKVELIRNDKSTKEHIGMEMFNKEWKIKTLL